MNQQLVVKYFCTKCCTAGMIFWSDMHNIFLRKTLKNTLKSDMLIHILKSKITQQKIIHLIPGTTNIVMEKQEAE